MFVYEVQSNTPSSCHKVQHWYLDMKTNSLNYLAALTAFSIIAAVECQARTHKHGLTSPEWQSSVKVAPDAPADVKSRANPVCEQLASSVTNHNAKLQAQIIDLAKSQTAPATSVYGAIKGLMGKHYETLDERKKLKALSDEKRTVANLNLMLTTDHCPPVDLEHEVIHGTARPQNANALEPPPAPLPLPSPPH